MRCDFEQCEHLGDRDMPELDPFDVVTCMFAIHYFFTEEAVLATFLGNVAGSLKDGEGPGPCWVNLRRFPGGEGEEAVLATFLATWRAA
jgi:hypothetical protein